MSSALTATAGRYAWGGFAITSDLALGRLHPADGSVVVEDAVFSRSDGPPPPHPVPSVERRLTFPNGAQAHLRIGGDERVLRYELEGVGCFIVDVPAASIVLYPDGAPSPGRIEHVLVNAVLGYLAGLRGLTCLHASVAARDGEAVVFAGPSGVGKSTALARRLDEGWRLLADDVAVLRRGDGGWNAYPTGRTIRLLEGDRLAGWDNNGKTESFVPSEVLPAKVSRIILMPWRGTTAEKSWGSAPAEKVRSLTAVQWGWSFAGRSLRCGLIEATLDLAGLVGADPRGSPGPRATGRLPDRAQAW